MTNISEPLFAKPVHSFQAKFVMSQPITLIEADMFNVCFGTQRTVTDHFLLKMLLIGFALKVSN
ncbi:hypothetical protein A9B99_09020 [Mangrovibacter phragmitis]|uniref:Transposase n=1 Tax=Mangrovibacter phragmitis TaxID=1691903 RepID=A0A1B7L2L7_9ENTR|nr:hypothetical protein A9B99_09020 [Mangrovibacter phragmitis]